MLLFNFSPFEFSKAKLRQNGHEAPPCFRPSKQENTTHKHLHILRFQYTSPKHNEKSHILQNAYFQPIQ